MLNPERNRRRAGKVVFGKIGCDQLRRQVGDDFHELVERRGLGMKPRNIGGLDEPDASILIVRYGHGELHSPNMKSARAAVYAKAFLDPPRLPRSFVLLAVVEPARRDFERLFIAAPLTR